MLCLKSRRHYTIFTSLITGESNGALIVVDICIFGMNSAAIFSSLVIRKSYKILTIRDMQIMILTTKPTFRMAIQTDSATSYFRIIFIKIDLSTILNTNGLAIAIDGATNTLCCLIIIEE